MSTTYEHTKRLPQQMITTFRSAIALLLMFTLGSGSVWGQTSTDYSGVYYFVNRGSGKVPSNSTNINDSLIANITDPDNYFYLVPADNPQQTNKRDAWFSSDYSTANGDPEKPYLTTYKTKKDAADVPAGVTNRPHNSVWIVKFASNDSGTDYYYLIHAVTGKYVVYEPPYSSKNNRKSVHLLTTDSPGEDAKFAITSHNDYYNFRPKSIGTDANTNKYLNAANANYNSYYSNDGTADNPADYFRGLLGLWKNNGSKDDGTGSDWRPEATLLTAPTISYDSDAKTFSISYDLLPAGYTILYTQDNSEPAIGGSTTSTYSSPVLVTGSNTVKAVVARYDMVLTEVATLEPCAKPVITYNSTTSKVSITSAAEGSTIYYTTDGSTPSSSSAAYSVPFSVDNQTTIKAVATKSGFVDSEIASVKVVLNPLITLAPNDYTYSGAAIEPTVNSVKDGETTIASSEYTVSYGNNTNAGTEAVVTVTDIPGGSYIVYGSANFTINRKKVTITADDASKTYDNTALTENGFTASALGTDDTHIFTVTMTEGSTIIHAGTEPNIIATVDGTAVTTGTETAIGNYLVTTVNGMLTISPKSLGDGNIPADGIAIVLNSSGELSAVKDGDTSLTDNIDYTYLTETDGNDKIVIVSGIGNYKDSAKGLYATPVFKDPNSSGVAAAVYNAKRDITSPSGITPYIVRKVNPTIGTLTISPIGYIPEDVPVLLLSDTEVEGFTASLKDSSTPVITDTEKSSNLLMIAPEGGVDVKDTEAYIFYRGEFVLTKKGTIKESSFFIYNPNYNANLEQNGQSGNAPCMTLHIVIDNSTGIDEIMVDANKGTRDDSWFTLDGRRLSNKPTQKGLYISNNRKVFIK